MNSEPPITWSDSSPTNDVRAVLTMLRFPVMVCTPSSFLRSVPLLITTSPCTTVPARSQLMGVPRLHSVPSPRSTHDSMPLHKLLSVHSLSKTQLSWPVYTGTASSSQPSV